MPFDASFGYNIVEALKNEIHVTYWYAYWNEPIGPLVNSINLNFMSPIK